MFVSTEIVPLLHCTEAVSPPEYLSTAGSVASSQDRCVRGGGQTESCSWGLQFAGGFVLSFTTMHGSSKCSLYSRACLLFLEVGFLHRLAHNDVTPLRFVLNVKCSPEAPVFELFKSVLL